MEEDRRRRLRRSLKTALAVTGLALVCAVPANALTGFTGVDEGNYYIPYNEGRCLYTGGNGELYGCSKHTFTFVSSNDCCGNAFTCARLWNRLDHSYYEGHCNNNLARHCMNGYGSGLDCSDQDHTANHAGGVNGDAGTTFFLRGRF